MPPTYRGRFAPSPTGPLHFGSLVAALGSWLEARCRGGEWLVRMEDLDPPREMAGAADRILTALERYGLHWDGPVLYQSGRGEAYGEALRELERVGALYACGCTRREVVAASPPGEFGPVYPGTCRGGLPPGRRPRALRVATEAHEIAFEDGLCGRYGQVLRREVGDFVVRRADGLIAYQLAVVVDDGAQGINAVVRGADLLDSTPRQIWLQQLLGLPTPDYLHLPLALGPGGVKLSKQSFAPPLPLDEPMPTLAAAWAFLGQEPLLGDPRASTPEEFLARAVERWSLSACRAHGPDESLLRRP